MSKRNKPRDVRAFPGQRGPQGPPVPLPPAGPGGPPPVRQKVTEIDGLKYRLAVQKEQTLLAKQETINMYRNLLTKEEENLKLRIALLQMENARDIGHLNLGQGDKVIQEHNDWFVERAKRPGPIPKIGAPPAPPKPEVPETAEVPPPPSADDLWEEEEEEEEEESAAPEPAPAKK